MKKFNQKFILGFVAILIGSSVALAQTFGVFEIVEDYISMSGTGAVNIPKGTTAERPTGASGDFRFNSETGDFEGHDGVEWGNIGGSVLTTKGDLQSFDGSEDVRVPVGTDGQVLTANSSAPAGVSYQDVAATLQDAYDNSTDGEVTLDNIIGGIKLTIADLTNYIPFSITNLMEFGKDSVGGPQESAYMKLGDKHLWGVGQEPDAWPRDGEEGSLAMSDNGAYVKTASNGESTSWKKLVDERTFIELRNSERNALDAAGSSFEAITGGVFTSDAPVSDGVAYGQRVSKTKQVAPYDSYAWTLTLATGTYATATKTVTNSSFENQPILMGCQLRTTADNENFTMRIDGEEVYSYDIPNDGLWHDTYYPYIGGSTDYEMEITTRTSNATRVDNCFLGARPKGYIQELTYENYTEIDLADIGDFTGGKIAVGRVGNQVTISLSENITHGSLSQPSSATSVIPQWATPRIDVCNVYNANTNVYRLCILTDGSLLLEYTKASDGGLTVRTSSGTPPTITYIAAEKKSSAHIVQQSRGLSVGKFYLSSNQSVPANTSTTLLFDSSIEEDGLSVDGGTGRVYVEEAGWYRAEAQAKIFNLATSDLLAMTLYSSTGKNSSDTVYATTSGDDITARTSLVTYVPAGGYFYVNTLQDYGAGSRDIGGSGSTTFMQVQRIDSEMVGTFNQTQIKKNEDKFVTDETPWGMWNGKQLYRRCFEVLADIASSATITTWEAGLTPAGMMNRDSENWFFQTESGGSNLSQVFYEGTTGNVKVYISGGTWKVGAGTSFCMEYTK